MPENVYKGWVQVHILPHIKGLDPSHTAAWQ